MIHRIAAPGEAFADRARDILGIFDEQNPHRLSPRAGGDTPVSQHLTTASRPAEALPR
jgi:hypothetical protein